MESVSGNRFVARLGTSVALLATAAAVHLHWVFLRHSGGLWRDEVAITNIATLPTRSAMWRALPHDHCPILFAAVLRTWAATFGGADSSLRILGFAIGLLLLASLWVAGTAMARAVPLLSLTVFALNVMVIRYGDSVRAYGLATACIILTMALIWRFVQTPSTLLGVAATVLAILSVQALYQNAVLVLALCVAGSVVFLRDRQWRGAIAVLAIGVPAALSLTPYIEPLLRAQIWWVVSKSGVSARIVWSNILGLTGHPVAWFGLLWPLLLIVAASVGFRHALGARRGTEPQNARGLALFAGTALVVGTTGFAAFVALARLPTEPWYFLLPIGFAVVCCDALLAGSSRWMRIVVLGTAAITLLLAYPAGIAAMKFRQTDGDLVAAQLSRDAGPGDLVIVNPWYCGLTINRYYRGAAPWTTLSGIDDYAYHRYDLLKARLELPHPDRAVLDRVSATLQAGHKVWIVGSIPIIRVGKDPPPDLPPAPHGPDGWFDEPYNWTWGAQLYYLVETRAQAAKSVPIDSNDRVNPLENMALYVVSGWRDAEQQ